MDEKNRWLEKKTPEAKLGHRLQETVIRDSKESW